MLSLIVSLDNKGGMGNDGKVPWHLPPDLKRFQQYTQGKWLVYGRRTWEGINKLMPRRHVVVVSRKKGGFALFEQDAVSTVTNAEDLPTLLKMGVAGDYRPEMVVGGGRQIFQAALPLVQKIYLTTIPEDLGATNFFPPWDRSRWEVVLSEECEGQGPNARPHNFSVLIRK